MRTESLFTFLSVANTHSITEAAHCEHMTQPAVSAILKQIEKEYQITLFERKPGQKKPLQLTPEGVIFQKYALEIVNSLSLLTHDLSALTQSERQFSIGSGKSNSIYFLPYILNGFNKAHPNSSYSVLTYPDSSIMIDHMLSGECDLGISVFKPNEEIFESKKLLSDSFVFISPTKLKLPSTITVEELKRLPIVVREKEAFSYRMVENALKKLGTSFEDLNIVWNTYDNPGLLQAVQTGVGCGFVLSTMINNDMLMKKEVRIIHIKSLRAVRELFIVRKRTIPMPPDMALLWNYITTRSWKELSKSK